MAEALDFLKKNFPSGLPQGVIHADLFPDNVFFTRDKLSGIIDFYFACNDALAYELAVWLNRPENALVTPKDPAEYIRKLRFHKQAGSFRDYGLI